MMTKSGLLVILIALQLQCTQAAGYSQAIALKISEDYWPTSSLSAAKSDAIFNCMGTRLVGNSLSMPSKRPTVV